MTPTSGTALSEANQFEFIRSRLKDSLEQPGESLEDIAPGEDLDGDEVGV